MTATVAASRRRDRAQGHLRLLAHAGVVDGPGTAAVLATFDEVRAMTWRLLNPRG